MKRKIFLILVVMFLNFSFVGCGEKYYGKIKIGVTLGNFEDTFILSLKNYIDSYVKSEYADEVEVVFADAKDDDCIQIGQVENFIAQQVNVVIILPVNTERTDPMTLACKEAKIPVVYLNREPRKLGDYVFYIGSDEKQAGKLQGEYIAKALNGKGNIAILMGQLDTESTFKRTEGVEEAVRDYPNIKIVKKQTGNWKKSLSMYITKHWFLSGSKIDAIISNNDEMAIGAIRYLEGAGKLDKTKILGIDATLDAIADLEAERITATVFQNGKVQAEGAVDKAVKVVKGESVDQITWIPFQLVTKDIYKDIVVR